MGGVLYGGYDVNNKYITAIEFWEVPAPSAPLVLTPMPVVYSRVPERDMYTHESISSLLNCQINNCQCTISLLFGHAK